MDMNYEFSYELMESLGYAIGTADLVINLLSFALGIAAYVLRSVGLYTIAKRRGISNPWLAWIPVAWVWVLGSISDQFRYVTKAQVKSKRKVLLAVNIIYAVLALVMVVVLIVNFVGIFGLAMEEVPSEDELVVSALSMLLQVLGISGVVLVVSVVMAVFRYMALYDLYTSVNPPCNVLFLVLSILFNITEPFFIFFNRNKDGGMPPRCDVPQEPVAYTAPSYIPAPPVQEPWENNSEE